MKKLAFVMSNFWFFPQVKKMSFLKNNQPCVDIKKTDVF